MHVHVVIDALGWGGAETLLGDFVAGAAQAHLRISVSYLADRDDNPAADRLVHHGIEPHLLPITGLLNAASQRMVRAHIAAMAPDIVHAHLDYADFLAGRAARRLGLPAVSTLHVLHSPSGRRARLKDRVISASRRRDMACVIAVSDAARQAAEAARWATRDQLVTLHNGVFGRPDPGGGRAIRAELGLAPTAPVVVMITVLRPGKGHAALLAAWPEVRRQVPGAVLLLAGDGPLHADLNRRSAALEGVRMLGYRSDVMTLLDSADLLAHPTEFDAFPTALLEALAAGTPIVATRVGGIPEIVQDGVHGRLLDAPAQPSQLAQALAELLADARLRRQFGAAGRARFEQHFTAERWVIATRALYERVIASRARASHRSRHVTPNRSESTGRADRHRRN